MNKSSAQDDLLRDMAQQHANVAVFQETLSWKKDGVADETGGHCFVKLMLERPRGGATEAVGTSSAVQNELEMGHGCAEIRDVF